MSHNHIVRTFHSIGQGAYYSERFYSEFWPSRNVVFDCGVKDVKDHHKSFVRGSFTKDDEIDYLFISHLDDDHISLVKTLKDTVRRIRNVVLPFISKDDVNLLRSLSVFTENSDVNFFWESLRMAYSGDRDDEDSPGFLFILPEEGEKEFVETPLIFSSFSGKHIASFAFDSVNTSWEIVPFCLKPNRKYELDSQLNALLKDVYFIKNVGSLGLQCNTLEELKKLLIKDSFAELINHKEIKKKLQDAYKAITGTINQNSLLVYSGPESKSHDYHLIRTFYGYFDDLRFHCRFSRNCASEIIYHRVACLYTGDSDLNIGLYNSLLGNRWANIGTIQLPHHGSLNSFKYSENKNKFDRPYFFPVSYGINNTYGHPSGKVLSYLLGFHCIPILVNENKESEFIQMIIV